jgi:RNA polymerase sigma-70 factor (ECF subfamily)
MGLPIQAKSIPAASDEEVVTRVLGGDKASYEILVRRHNQRLYRAAYAILRNADEAEDVMQETWVRAFRHLNQFAGQASFSTWLTKIAVYEALNRLKKRSRLQSFESMQEGGRMRVQLNVAQPGNPEREAFDREIRAALEKAIELLPQIYRVVFVLRAVEGMSGAETALCLGIPEETVKTRLHRARALLRRRLVKRFGAAARETFRFLNERCDGVTLCVLARIASLGR